MSEQRLKESFAKLISGVVCSSHDDPHESKEGLTNYKYNVYWYNFLAGFVLSRVG